MSSSKILTTTCGKIDSYIIKHSDSCLDISPFKNKLQSLWENVVRNTETNGEKIWDGTYYRLENYPELVNGKKELVLSTIPYSMVRALILLNREIEIDESFYPLHINTGAWVKTNEGSFVFGEKTSAAGNTFIDLIGGGLQKDELEILESCDIEKNILKELGEETNINIDAVKCIELNSFVLTNTMSIFILFEITVNLSEHQIADNFDARSDKELSGLRFVKKEDITSFCKEKHAYEYLSLLSKLIT